MLQGGAGAETLYRNYYRCPHPGCTSKKQLVFDGDSGEVPAKTYLTFLTSSRFKRAKQHHILAGNISADD